MKQILLVTVLITLLISCQNSSELSVPGYEIVMHAPGDGVAAYPGSHVMFNFESFDYEDNLLQAMDGKSGNQPQVMIPNESEDVPYSAFLELLKQVNAGDSLSLFVPFDSIAGAPPKLQGTQLEYRLKITDIMSQEEFNVIAEKEKALAQQKMIEAQEYSQQQVEEAQQQLTKYKKNGKQVITTTNGIKIMIIEEGRGVNAQSGNQITVDYVGLFKDGEKFDDSYSRGQPFSFKVGSGQVIPGWDEGFQYLNIGTKALLDIPYALAYGEQGSPPSIPAKSDLIFVVEVNAIN